MKLCTTCQHFDPKDYGCYSPHVVTRDPVDGTQIPRSARTERRHGQCALAAIFHEPPVARPQEIIKVNIPKKEPIMTKIRSFFSSIDYLKIGVLVGFFALAGGLLSSVKAVEIPFDWSCNAAGTHCRAPGLNAPAKKFPKEFHKRFNYPHEIVVEHPDDYAPIVNGWTKRGDCEALLKDKIYPDVAFVKAKYCAFWQAGYAAPKPKIVKGW